MVAEVAWVDGVTGGSSLEPDDGSGSDSEVEVEEGGVGEGK